jgi:hypothetical protein
MNTKRIIIVGVVVAALFILVIGAYFLFFAPKPTSTQTGSSGSLPSTGTQNINGTGGSASGTANTIGTNFGVISNNPTLDYFVNASNAVTAIQPDGEVDQISGGNVTTLSSLQVPNILSASFSYDGTKILVSSGNPTAPTVSVFDVATAAWSPLGTGWQSVAWSPVDYRVAYVKTNANGTETFATINAANLKAAPVTLLTLHAQDLTVAWPLKNQLILSTQPSALVAGSAWSFTLSSASLAPIVYETPGLATIWNSGATAAATTSSIPFGLQFSSGNDGLGGYLTLIDDYGNTLQQIKFVTLPSKCSFASQAPTGGGATSSASYLFCGVPRDQTDLAYNHLPDDYNQLALFTIDDLYRINLQTGAIDTVFDDPSQSLDISDVKLFNNILFFINRYDNKLYAISLSA